MQWCAKALAVCVVAFALSPIDLIPDPIPLLGDVDDLVLLPLGILLVLRHGGVPRTNHARVCNYRRRVDGSQQR